MVKKIKNNKGLNKEFVKLRHQLEDEIKDIKRSLKRYNKILSPRGKKNYKNAIKERKKYLKQLKGWIKDGY